MSLLNLNDEQTVAGYASSPQPFSKLYVYHAGTDTLSSLYEDSNLTNTLANPLVADENGLFDLCYLVDGSYRVRIEDTRGAGLIDQDSVMISSTVSLNIAKSFLTVTALLEDTTMSYQNSRSRHRVMPDDILQVVQGNNTYKVAGSDVTDHHLTTAGGIKLYLTNVDKFDVTAFGAVEGTDASAALQAAFDVWVDRLENSHPACMTVRGCFQFSTPIQINFTRNVFSGGTIDMRGGLLSSNVPAGQGASFSIKSERTVRKIDLLNLNLNGSGVEDVLFEIDGGDGNATHPGFFYGWNLMAPKLEGFSTIGMWVHNNAFEGTISDPYFACSSKADGTYCMLCQDNTGGATSGNVSSMVLLGGVMRGGEHNLFCDDNSDIRCYGTTFLHAGHEAIVEHNMTGGCYSGIHIENPWDNGGSGIMAGIRVTNRPNLSDVYVLGNNGNVNTGVSVFPVGSDCRIDNVVISRDLTNIVHVQNNSDTGARLTLSGIRRNRVSFASSAAQRMVCFTGRQAVGRFTATNSNPVTVEVYRNNVFDVTCQANTVIATPIYMVTGDRITFILTQDSTGGRSVTWPGNFRVAQTFDPTPDTSTVWEFIWTGSLWLQLNSAGL